MERWGNSGDNSIYYYYDESGVCGMNYNGSEYYFRKNILAPGILQQISLCIGLGFLSLYLKPDPIVIILNAVLIAYIDKKLADILFCSVTEFFQSI